jgi:hypothetical protein
LVKTEKIIPCGEIEAAIERTTRDQRTEFSDVLKEHLAITGDIVNM